MDKFAAITGRQYNLFDYVGAPDAERVIVMMGSGGEAAQETVEVLNEKGEKVGVLKVRLFRPFAVEHFVGALPKTVKAIAVLDRTKEAGAPASRCTRTSSPPWPKAGEGAAARQASSAAATAWPPRNSPRPWSRASSTSWPRPSRRTTSPSASTTTSPTPASPTIPTSASSPMTWCAPCSSAWAPTARSARTRTRSRSSARRRRFYAQGYFVYDSKKSGSLTISHLRFGPRPIHAPYLIQQANFVACTSSASWSNSTCWRTPPPARRSCSTASTAPDEVWDQLPRAVQEQIIDKKLKFYVIDAYKVARETGMGGRINTIMQTCFFAISGVLPRDEAIEQDQERDQEDLRQARRGGGAEELRRRGRRAGAPARGQGAGRGDQHRFRCRRPCRPRRRSSCGTCTATIIAGDGDVLPVSAMPVDGTFPTGTTQWEKRNIALEIPVWDPDVCIQCGKCVLVCPHAVIRAKVYDAAELADAPATFKSADAKLARSCPDKKYTLQVAAKTAPAARCASKSARPRTRATSAARPSTWSRSCRCASRSAPTGSSS